LAVRASSLDVKTVGAGGGSIAYVPELTKALRVGPQSAGAVPGPVAYGKGGEAPTVTDANVVLGYLPENLLGGTFQLDREGAKKAVQTIADALGIDLMAAARGIIDIVNENMFGALRMISVQQGYDPRHFALMGFGGAGPLHVNAVARLMGSWPAISPMSPGVLCALGDATTRMRTETARSFSRLATTTDAAELVAILKEMAEQTRAQLQSDGINDADISSEFEIDVRYAGQAFEVPLTITPDILERDGVAGILKRFDEEHLRLFTFNMDTPHEIVNLRAVALGQALDLPLAGRIHVLSGIGHPERFLATLEILCKEKVPKLPVWIPNFFEDHHVFQIGDFSGFSEEEWIVMTEKDAVKCRNLALSSERRARIAVLRIHAELNSDFFDRCKSLTIPPSHLESQYR
jgi:N-methylhydantoinase A